MRTPETWTGPIQYYKPVKYKILAIETEFIASGPQSPQFCIKKKKKALTYLQNMLEVF